MTFSNLQASGPETFPQLRTRVSSCLERAGVSKFWHFSAVPTAPSDVQFQGECVAKLFAALRTRNYQIQLNGIFALTLRACARP